MKRMTRQQVMDLYFLEARSKVIDLAAFLDRVERPMARRLRLKALRALQGLATTKTKGQTRFARFQ
jgi:hypothetical protein